MSVGLVVLAFSSAVVAVVLLFPRLNECVGLPGATPRCAGGTASPPKVEEFLPMKSLKILSAKNLHIPGGYAAVGDV